MSLATGRSFLSSLLALPLVVGLAACTPGDLISPRAAAATELAPFDSCDQLLDYFQEHALERVGPWGFGGGIHYPTAVDFDGAGDEAGAAADLASVPQEGSDYSGTNNQEVGVEEPDLVQTDGRIIVTTREDEVVVVDASTGEKVGSVRLPLRAASEDHELLLDRTTGMALVLTREYGGGYQPMGDHWPAYGTERTVLTTVDLSDPTTPTVLGGVRLEGSYRSARMIDGSVRVVLVTDPPGLSFTHPRVGSLLAEQAAEEANRQIIRDSTLDDWLPHRQQLDADGSASNAALVADCQDYSRPAEFSGLATMTVLTLDLSSGQAEPSSATGLVATGSTVYASTERLLVATSPWDAWRTIDTMPWDGRERVNTALHSFDISDPSGTSYVASGRVEGRLLNQFALSETDGVIRVAVTLDARSRGDSQSALVMLRAEGEQLVETGRVDGLGLTERIYSVRYLSPDLAAIVTFRETDPLYLIDTSDPSAPHMVGELKIPGYSAYLHPVGNELLLGIGQDATETGMTIGLQASLFDISDPTDPQRIDQLTWKDHGSEVEWDHRAFTYWAQTGQFFLPASSWSQDSWSTGILAPRLEGRTLVDGPSVAMDDGARSNRWDQPRRTVVIGDAVWVLGWHTLSRYDLGSLELEDRVEL